MVLDDVRGFKSCEKMAKLKLILALILPILEILNSKFNLQLTPV